MKPNYRITFTDGPTGNRQKSIDVYATDSDDAFSQAYKMPEAKSRQYTSVLISEIPDGPSLIGIEFETYDSVCRRTFTNRVFVMAKDEAEAKAWYKRNLMGKKTFCIYPEEPEPDAKCSYGRIRRTYFAAGCGGGFDAKVDL